VGAPAEHHHWLLRGNRGANDAWLVYTYVEQTKQESCLAAGAIALIRCRRPVCNETRISSSSLPRVPVTQHAGAVGDRPGRAEVLSSTAQSTYSFASPRFPATVPRFPARAEES